MIRSDTFQFLRKTPVNLSRYLPHFLYNDELFKDTQDALNIEHERYRLKLIETAREFFVSTATVEGIESFERLLKITPTGDLELRRKVVAMKLARQFVPTPDGIKNLMREFLRTGSGEVDVEETKDNRLKLILENGDFYWQELWTALMEWLPAHLLIYDILIINNFGDFDIYYAQPTLDATFDKFGLDLLSPPPLIITPKIFVVDTSTDTIDFKNIDENLAQDLKFSTFTQIAETMKIPCGDSFDDEETIEDFERYILEKWRQFKKNAVIKWYMHGEIYDGEDDEEEFFPVGVDFLRIYWGYPDCPNDANDRFLHYRYQTILDPRENIQPAEINYLSNTGKNLLLHGKLKVPSTGIIRAVYIKKEEIKVL